MDQDTSYESFLKYQKDGLLASNVPKYLWENLHKKIVGQIFDAGNDFALIGVETDRGIPRDRKYKVVVVNKNGINHQSSDAIWLVDHCWTWRDRDCADFNYSAKAQLENIDGLKARMTELMNMDAKSTVEDVLDEVWRWNQPYFFPNDLGQTETLWYCLDEFGSSIRHHGDPNFTCIPLYITFYGYSISILYPRRSVGYCDEIGRDYCYGIKDLDHRKVMMMPWVKSKLDAPIIAPLKQVAFFEKVFENVDVQLPAVDTNLIPSISPPEKNIKVFTKCRKVAMFLSDEKYTIVEDEALADIVWLTQPIHDFKTFFDQGPHQFINSFPYELLITVPAYLSEIAKYDRDLDDEQSPSWFTATYDMLTEFDCFVAFFMSSCHKEQNFALVSPDGEIHTRNLNEIIRMTETKKPILIRRIETGLSIDNNNVNFRLIFLIKSIEPLEAYVVDCVQVRLRQTEDSRQESTIQIYSGSNFSDIEKFGNLNLDNLKIKGMHLIKKTIEMSTSRQRHSQMRLVHYPQSRGFYYTDFQIRNTENGLEPILDEIGSNVDLENFEGFIPDFTNKLFNTLFYDDHQLPVIDLNSI